MTREEATEILSEKLDQDTGRARWIDAFLALGMLKLDEPKRTATERALTIFGNGTWANPEELEFLLWDAGLKIVEK